MRSFNWLEPLKFYLFVTIIFVVQAAMGATPTGADWLFDNNFNPLLDKSVGLVTNSAATNLHDSSLVSALAKHPRIDLRAVFSPEHGFFIESPAGEAVKDRFIENLQVEIYSLYGRAKKPTPEMLKGIDILVFDIQEVGARFYTYISTLALTMEAAAQAGIEYIVLDRPNPVALLGVQGPVLDEELLSFIGIAPVPILHGLTIGELANMMIGEGWINNGDKLNLSIIPLKGWDHSTPFQETGLPWIPPSPNIPDLETAYLYPGMALFEATNLSEGRGTPNPFKTIGAPWLEMERLGDSMCCPGLSCRDTVFVPQTIRAMAVNPKYEDQQCHGIRLSLHQLADYDPVHCALRMLISIRQAYPAHLLIDRERMAKMLGSKELVNMLLTGASIEELTVSYQDELDQFLKKRKKYLLYDE